MEMQKMLRLILDDKIGMLRYRFVFIAASICGCIFSHRSQEKLILLHGAGGILNRR